MNKPLQLTGKVVLITGATNGAGGTIAEAFLSAGATVVACSRRKLRDDLENVGRHVQFEMADSDDPEQIKACLTFVTTRFGRLDILVNGNLAALEGEACTESAETIIRRGLITPLHFCQAANGIMQDQDEGGTIINIACSRSGDTSQQPVTGEAADSGLANLGGSLAVEWAPRVRVNTIVIDLPQTEQPEHPAGNLESVNRASTATPDQPGPMLAGDMGRTCLFLVSSLASYISGARISLA